MYVSNVCIQQQQKPNGTTTEFIHSKPNKMKSWNNQQKKKEESANLKQITLSISAHNSLETVKYSNSDESAFSLLQTEMFWWKKGMQTFKDYLTSWECLRWLAI